ncbi:hypothetical protein [Paenibacillus sp. AD87]|uniref:hypothetical protein n=1 Tax=Paenibacillus sp. AD87 TaxID=1528787 RepID=UPI0007FCC664|nr:hypothetical protein [Paenibacillus sp. AD87]OAX48474.1 Foldase protein PrsA [Paenibacillus sp. AD87]
MKNKKKKIYIITSLIIVLSLLLSACGEQKNQPLENKETSIRIGTKDFTENLIVG